MVGDVQHTRATSSALVCERILAGIGLQRFAMCLRSPAQHKAEEDRREEMKAMAKTLQLHGLERDEVNMITGVLEMHSKTARDISMPLEQAKMLAHDEVSVLFWSCLVMSLSVFVVGMALCRHRVCDVDSRRSRLWRKLGALVAARTARMFV